VTVELGSKLRGGPCRVLSRDQRIVARGGEHYFYADASGVCGKMELESGANDVLANPAIVIEVLSNSTSSKPAGASR